MSSQVDATFPADNVKVSKSEMRAQFLIIKQELTDLMQKTLTGFTAFHSFASQSEVRLMIKRAQQGLARDLAFGRVSL